MLFEDYILMLSRYVSRYMIHGARFYDQDTTIFLHRPLQLPQVPALEATNVSSLHPINKFQPLDGSGGWVLQASIQVADGNNPELKDRATKQLLALRETLRQAVTLTPGDRLALDTKITAGPRR